MYSTTSTSKDAPQVPLTPAQKERIHSMVRVDHAGEVGANTIYAGQLAVFSVTDPEIVPLIQHMWDQEKVHLAHFDSVIAEHNIRPSLLRPVWEAAGFVVGAGTALMGRKAGMACTEAVETVIGGHYNDQLRHLANIKNNKQVQELTKSIAQFRDDELEHLDHAEQNDSAKAPFHTLLTGVIQAGCKTAIEIAKRV